MGVFRDPKHIYKENMRNKGFRNNTINQIEEAEGHFRRRT